MTRLSTLGLGVLSCEKKEEQDEERVGLSRHCFVKWFLKRVVVMSACGVRN